MAEGSVFLADSVDGLDSDMQGIPDIQGDDGDGDDMEVDVVVGMTCVDLRLDKFRYISYNAIKHLRFVSFSECFRKDCEMEITTFLGILGKERSRSFDRMVYVSLLYFEIFTKVPGG